jgi:hypothetical protein
MKGTLMSSENNAYDDQKIYAIEAADVLDVLTSSKDYYEGVIDNLPANPSKLYRHELRKGSSDKAIEDISEELDIDNKLGLVNQAEITATNALRHDIDVLTTSKDYFEVYPKLLEKLFKIGSLRRKCFWYNLKSAAIGFIQMSWLPLFFHIAFLALIYPMLKFSFAVFPWEINSFEIFIGIVNIICWVGMLMLLVLGFSGWDGRVLKRTELNVKLETIPLGQVKTKIPRGAKLKVLEAQNTHIFQEFVYVTPDFEAKSKYFEVDLKKILPPIDPAILGITIDKRLYMIVYWDIEKDIEKVVKKIDHFKKFKLNKSL